MTERVFLQPAFVVHARPFSETSLLVDLLTRDYGRLSAIARGARSPQSRYRGHLRSFVPLLISWSGRSELVSLNQIETNGSPILLEGNSLLAGLYINELVVHLMHRHDAHPDVFNYYQASILALNQSQNIEPTLRDFEKNLLTGLGFGFSWAHAADTSNPIESSKWYAFQPDLGFCENLQNHNNQTVFNGAHLLAIAQNNYESQEVLRTAKQIMRMTMQVRLGNKVIKSRELFI